MKHQLTWLESHALARRFLTQKGFDILEDDYSRGLNHIDFIAFDQHEQALVFIEFRLRHHVVPPNENPRRDFNKRRFEQLTLSFLSKYPCLATYNVRADQLNLVSFEDGERVIVYHYSNVASIVFS